MAKATVTEAPEPKFVTPKALAEELGVDAKRIRSFLRQEMTRPGEAKNTSWLLDEAAAKAVRERFTPAEDDDSEDTEDES
jgi:hypothetical protein